MPKYDKADIERRMAGAVESLKSDLGGLRTGRANTSLLDPVVVEVYGSMMPLNQVATVSAPEPRMLSVQVWDKANLTAVEKGIEMFHVDFNQYPDSREGDDPINDLRNASKPLAGAHWLARAMLGYDLDGVDSKGLTLQRGDLGLAPDPLTTGNLETGQPYGDRRP